MSPQCANLQEAQISRMRLMALAPTDQSSEDGGGHVSSAQGSCKASAGTLFMPKLG